MSEAKGMVINMNKRGKSKAFIADSKEVDFFSLLEAENAVHGVETVVCSIGENPSKARLTQGNNEDMYLIIADNLGLVASKIGVKQVIFKASKELSNRSEILQTLKSYNIDVKILHEEIAGSLPQKGNYKRISNVCSVQRLPLPPSCGAQWVAQHYMEWLPKFSKGIIKVKEHEQGVFGFYLFFLPSALLQLTLTAEESSKDRVLYYVTGGLLANSLNKKYKGRFEFRKVLGGKYVLAAIHDFIPALPWHIYRLTQAPIHLLVMNSFGRHLKTTKLGQT
ncbi:hypothetical protein GGQ84_001723 [Desulfitispora alkaliphila]